MHSKQGKRGKLYECSSGERYRNGLWREKAELQAGLDLTWGKSTGSLVSPRGESALIGTVPQFNKKALACPEKEAKANVFY